MHAPLRDEPEIPIVTMTPIRADGVNGVWLTRARGASAFAIAVLRDGRVLVFPRHNEYDDDDDTSQGQHVELSGRQVKELAGVLCRWRADRRAWAAHAGTGQNRKWYGSDPVLYWPPGRDGVRICYEDPRFALMVRTACRARLVAAERTQGAYGDATVYGKLISHLDEPLGVVVRILDGRCAILLRHVAVVGGCKWPPDRSILELAASNTSPSGGGDHVTKIMQADGFVTTIAEAAVVEAAAAELCG